MEAKQTQTTASEGSVVDKWFRNGQSGLVLDSTEEDDLWADLAAGGSRIQSTLEEADIAIDEIQQITRKKNSNSNSNNNSADNGEIVYFDDDTVAHLITDVVNRLAAIQQHDQQQQHQNNKERVNEWITIFEKQSRTILELKHLLRKPNTRFHIDMNLNYGIPAAAFEIMHELLDASDKLIDEIITEGVNRRAVQRRIESEMALLQREEPYEARPDQQRQQEQEEEEEGTISNVKAMDSSNGEDEEEEEEEPWNF